MTYIKKFNSGEQYIIQGHIKFTLSKGKLSSVGTVIDSSTTITVPEGKSIPVTFTGNSELKISDKFKFEDHFNKTRVVLPDEWEILVKTIKSHKVRSIMVLGEVDTGKTFLSTYLANRLLTKGVRVSVIDCDLGQSDIGPPGTIGHALIKRPTLFLSEHKADNLYFVGAHSPGLHMLQFITGVKKIFDLASGVSKYIIIDTLGWVIGDGGRLLKNSKIRMIDPDIIVLLQRRGELEHLVRPFPEKLIFRLAVSKKASHTSQRERQKLREMICARYFSRIKTIKLKFGQFRTTGCFLFSGSQFNCGIKNILYSEKLSGYEGILVVCEGKISASAMKRLKTRFGNIRIVDPTTMENLTVGILDARHNNLGQGIIKRIDFKRKTLFLYLPDSIKKLPRILHFGSLKVYPDGKEAGLVSPGSF